MSFFGQPPRKKTRPNSNAPSPATKKQTTITSFFQAIGDTKLRKLEFVDINAEKKQRTPRKTLSFAVTPKKTESVTTTPPPHVSSEAKTSPRKCPYYKRIPDTSFAVDAFSYGSIPGVKHYFLSHFHYDHYCGLKKKFSHPLYCTKITANLIMLKIGVRQKYLKICPLNEAFIVDGIIVELFEANHCPGSVMILFQFPHGRRILHTGDFRATSNMPSDCNLHDIDTIYLDTTYLDPYYCFPSQDCVVSYAASLIEEKLKIYPKTLIVCGSYTIGKERLFLAIAKACNLKIWAAADKRRILHCLEDSFLNGCLVTNGKDAQIHVLPMNQLSFSELHRHMLNFEGIFDKVVAFRPTGWTCQKSTSMNIENIIPRSSGRVSLYDVPYSEHSSFDELKAFVQAVHPQKVIPTVRSKSNKCELDAIIKGWLK